MKAKNLILIMAFALISLINRAQSGANCANAIAISINNSVLSSNYLSGTEMWYSFVADSIKQNIGVIKMKTSIGHVHSLKLYSGTCSNLNLLDDTTVTSTNDSTLVLNEESLNIGSTYYIKLTRESSGCIKCLSDVTFDLDMENTGFNKVFCMVACGLKYSTANVKLNQRVSPYAGTGSVQPAAMSMSGIPNSVQVVTAYLWFSVVGEQTPGTFPGLSILDPFGTPVGIGTVTCIGSENNSATGWLGSPGTNFAYGNTNAYRAALTITGYSGAQLNGNYTIDGLPTINTTNPDIDVTGATIMIIYKDNCSITYGALYIEDGIKDGGLCYGGQSFSPCIPVIPANIQTTQFLLCADVEDVTGIGACEFYNGGSSTYFNADMWNFVSSVNYPWNNTLAFCSAFDVNSIAIVHGYYFAAYSQTCQISNISTSGNTTICKGIGVQLTATAAGATSYNWSPGSGLSNSHIQNPMANPAVTTTYTVTAINSAACAFTSAVTVTVVSATPPIIYGDQTNCKGSGLFGYVIGNYQNTSNYTVSLGNPTHGTIINTYLNLYGSFTMNWNSSAFVGSGSCAGSGINETITVSVKDAQGCKSSSTITIYPCCKYIIGDQAFPVLDNEYTPNLTNYANNFATSTGTGSGAVITVTHKKFTINNTLVLGSNLVFDECDIKMGANAKIVIPQGSHYSITIKNTYMRACCAMWDGIYNYGPLEAIFVNNSLIEDAKTAVNTDNGGQYLLVNSVFNKNYKGLVVGTHGYSGSMIGSVVSKTIFTCRAMPASITGSTLTVFNWITALPPFIAGYLSSSPATSFLATSYPVLGSRAYTGIEANFMVNSTPLQFGNPATIGSDNIFDFMDFGIRLMESNVTIQNNWFKNIKNPTIPPFPPYSKCAIYARLKSGPKNLKVGGSALTEKNYFYECSIGVFAQNYNADVIKNVFSNIYKVGIDIEDGAMTTINIDGNEMTNVNGGILCRNIGGCANTLITNNSIDITTGVGAGPPIAGYGIYVVNTNINTTNCSITHNPIQKAKTAIWVERANGVLVEHNNNIDFIGLSNNLQLYGIRVVNSEKCTVQFNTIQKSSGGLPTFAMLNLLRGIALENSAENTVYKNTLFQMGTGIYATGSCPHATLSCNNLDHCYNGFHFSSANIDHQLGTGMETGNQWASFVANSDITGTVNSYTTWFYNSNTPTTLNANNVYPTFTNFLNPCTGGHQQLTNVEEREMTIGKIVRNENVYDTLSAEFKLRDSIFAYHKLKNDSTWLSLGTADDTLYHSFYKYTKSTNIGKFEQIKELLIDSAMYDTTDVQIINQNIDSKNTMDENQQIVNAIYIHKMRMEDRYTTIDYHYEYDSTEVTTLESVAYQDPLFGGDGVYQARVMLFIDVIDDELTRSLLINQTETENKIPDYRMYPNPNNGEMQLSYKLVENEEGYVNIYNLLGEKVSHDKLIKDATIININEPRLKSGIYFYKIYINDKSVYSGKVVISK